MLFKKHNLFLLVLRLDLPPSASQRCGASGPSGGQPVPARPPAELSDAPQALPSKRPIYHQLRGCAGQDAILSPNEGRLLSPCSLGSDHLLGCCLSTGRLQPRASMQPPPRGVPAPGCPHGPGGAGLPPGRPSRPASAGTPAPGPSPPRRSSRSGAPPGVAVERQACLVL